MKNKMLKRILGATIALLTLVGAFVATGCSEGGDESSPKSVTYGTITLVAGSMSQRYVNTLELNKAKGDIIGLGGKSLVSNFEADISGNRGVATVRDVEVGKWRAVKIQGYKDTTEKVKGAVLYGYIKEMKAGDNPIEATQKTSAAGKIVYEAVKAGCTEAQLNKLTKTFLDGFENKQNALVNTEAVTAALKAGNLGNATTYIMKPGKVEFNITKGFSGTAVSGRGLISRAGGSDGLTIYVKQPVGTKIWAWEDGGIACSVKMGYDWNSRHSTTEDCGHDGWSQFFIPAEFTSGKTIKFKLNAGGSELTGAAQTFWYDNSASTAEPAGWSGSSGGGTGGGGTTPSTPTTPSTKVGFGLSAGTVIYISDPLSNAVTISAGVGKFNKVDANGKPTDVVSAEQKINGDQGELIIYDVAPGTWDVYKRIPGDYSDLSNYKSETFAKMGSVTVTSDTETTQGTHGVNLVDKGQEIKPEEVTPDSGGGGTGGGGTGGGGTQDDTPQEPTQSESDAVATSYYWTNKDGAVGTEKTISDFTDWTAAERIAQCAAYDDPRTWRGIQESPYDCYAIYAAYDDTNLYLMVELTNCATAGRATFMNHDYAGGDNSNWDNRDIPLGWIFNTGKGPKCVKDTTEKGGKPIWDAVKFSDSQGFNYLTYHSSKCVDTAAGKSCGTPGWFTSNGTSFDYGTQYTTTYGTKGNGVNVKYQPSLAVSSKVWFEATPTGNRAESDQTAESLMSSTNYKDAGPATGSKDCSYMYTIPYAALGIDKAWIKSNGIGVRQLTTGGGSLMDCCPWDPAMVDVVNQPYSQDESTSAEKEDKDELTTPQARVGHM